MTGNRPTTPEDRARYRRFVKKNHPDVGGDPATFVAGLAVQRISGRVPEWDDTARYDAPVVIVPKHHRIRLLAGRLWRRLRGSPTVRVR